MWRVGGGSGGAKRGVVELDTATAKLDAERWSFTVAVAADFLRRKRHAWRWGGPGDGEI